MPALEKSLRTKLENTVKAAREVAEAGARSSLEQIGVGDADAPKHLSLEEKDLRRRLRIHGRQLGDEPGQKKGTQTIERLVEEVAYEHWHRLLFASFLAANQLLMYPDPDEPVAVTISECDDMAADEGARNGWELAARYAAIMLPQIFRVDSPIFDLELPPENQQQLEKLVALLPSGVFTASDSLGWVYQFWQSKKKKEVNELEVKIGARELPAVTQLFTEDYMVDFLLDNTLGAWHAEKILGENPKLAETARSEDELRSAAALAGCSWSYLRFIKSENGKWGPAAGTFDGWPKAARELKCLDPCMGSGHFVVAMFERLVALRCSEEDSNEIDAVKDVIRDNLFGLEIDPRCTQIAAFNVALSAWRRTGYITLPPLNLACSGLAPNAGRDQWLNLANGNEKLQNGMSSLYQMFQDAPVLGSLVNPRAAGGDLLVAAYHELQPLLEKALAQETNDEAAHEMAVVARGLAKAAEILAKQFSLVATNVPYLKGGEHGEQLKGFCESTYPESKYDLATVFIQRCHDLIPAGGHLAVVTQQYWLFLKYYEGMRESMILKERMPLIARLGPNAFEQISGEVVNVCLQITSRGRPVPGYMMAGIEVDQEPGPIEKAEALLVRSISQVPQVKQLKNPDRRIFLVLETNFAEKLSTVADFGKGSVSGDGPHYLRVFWEVDRLTVGRKPWLNSPSGPCEWSGREHFILWGEGDHNPKTEIGFAFRGERVFGKRGVAIGKAGSLRPTIYTGELFDDNLAVVCPYEVSDVAAVWLFSSSKDFEESLRRLDKKMSVTAGTFTKVPFDVERWRSIAAERYPDGLPKPFSSDATQWLFNGHPAGADQSLQVAVARLVGYQWPRQTGSSFPDCPAIDEDGLEIHADKDGIVCIPPVRGEASAADRLLNLLAAAYGPAWNGDVLNRLLAEAGYAGKSLDAWLRDEFFSEHLEVFQKRPFVWHVWDGLRDGFSALVNYHKLDHKNLETLIYTYLGDWISRCESEDNTKGLSEDGEKTTAAKNLKRKLEWILEGQAPYDIFVRWKPLHHQPIGWNPDINDGVRINIRPFLSVPDVKAKGAGVLRVNPKIKWDKDRGKEPERSKQDYPWFWGWDEKTTDFPGGPEFKGERFNDCHYTLDAKRQARAKAGKP